MSFIVIDYTNYLVNISFISTNFNGKKLLLAINTKNQIIKCIKFNHPVDIFIYFEDLNTSSTPVLHTENKSKFITRLYSCNNHQIKNINVFAAEDI